MNRFFLLLSTICFTVVAQTRIPLIEEFSSSTCPPCATFNSTIFTPFLTDAANAGKFTCVNYRMNWPGNGDPYYTAEGGTRKTLYSVRGVPEGVIDGDTLLDADYQSLSAFKAKFSKAAAKTAKATIVAVHQITGETPATGNVSATVTVTTTQDISNGYLFIALCEKKTTKNASTNGEKEFHHVMMKMVPNASGTAVTLKANTPVTVQKTTSLTGTHIEEMTDLEVVVWVQVSGTKEILQSAWSIAVTTPVAGGDIKHINTPSHCVSYIAAAGTIRITKAYGSTVKVYNCAGREVFRTEVTSSVADIRAGVPAKGIHLVMIEKGALHSSYPVMIY
jgi:hypothetical protein